MKAWAAESAHIKSSENADQEQAVCVYGGGHDVVDVLPKRVPLRASRNRIPQGHYVVGMRGQTALDGRMVAEANDLGLWGTQCTGHNVPLPVLAAEKIAKLIDRNPPAAATATTATVATAAVAATVATAADTDVHVTIHKSAAANTHTDIGAYCIAHSHSNTGS